MEKITKDPAYQYYIAVDGQDWATFTISMKGDFFINSGWGYWACNWRSFGTDFKGFLIRMDVQYLILNILRQQIEFGGKKTIHKRVEEAITILFAKFQQELKSELQTTSNGSN
jgi:hypothetical protein